MPLCMNNRNAMDGWMHYYHYYHWLHLHKIQQEFVTQQDTIRQIIKLDPLESSINVMMPVIFNDLHAESGMWMGGGGGFNLLNPDGEYTFSWSRWTY